ncbi:MAG: serine hydrolase domain-containing protein, partial [Planctomycetota bacterium]
GAAGESFVDYCKRALFEPAGMTVTCFTGDAPPAGVAVATGRSEQGDRSALDHPYGDSYGFQYRGMGGAVTNVWDLWRWDRALSRDDVLDTAGKAELFRVGLNDYALGWYVERDEQGRGVHRHSGSVRGFTAEMRRYPEQQACIVVLTNRSRYPVQRVVQALEEQLFDDERTIQPLPRPLELEQAQSLAGEYRDEGRNTLVVTVEGAVTHARIDWANESWGSARAFLGQDERGQLVFYEWRSATPLAIERRGKRIKGLQLGQRFYERR